MKLPSTWRRVRLGEICEINPRLPIGLNITDKTKVTFLPMAAVDESSGKIAQSEERSYREVKKGFTPFIEKDVLFAKITPSMENGKSTIARDLVNGIGFGSTEFHVIRCSDQVLEEFVFYFIRQPTFRLWAKSSFVGSAGQQRVPADFLARIPFPLPTIPEQQHIVEIFKQVDSIRCQREEVLQRIMQLPSALFLEMFGSPDPKINQRWDIETLGKITQIETGGTPSRARKDLYNGDIPWVKSTELVNGKINGTDEKISEVALGRSNIKLFPPGTVLLAMYGQGRTRGRTGLLEIAATCNQACAAVLPNSELLPDYIYVWLQCSYDRIRALGRGGQQENLNLNIVRSLKIPKPPIKNQKEFCEMMLVFEEIKDRANKNIEQFDTILNYILQVAFSGGLTSSWRETHRKEIKTWSREYGKDFSKKARHDFLKEITLPERTIQAHHTRRWLLDQLSEVQLHVYNTLREWKGPLIPSEDLDRFLGEWPVENLEDRHNQVLCALDQLSGLGIIARVCVPNQTGDYSISYRILREDELTKADDLKRLEVLD